MKNIRIFKSVLEREEHLDFIDIFTWNIAEEIRAQNSPLVEAEVEFVTAILP